MTDPLCQIAQKARKNTRESHEVGIKWHEQRTGVRFIKCGDHRLYHCDGLKSWYKETEQAQAGPVDLRKERSVDVTWNNQGCSDVWRLVADEIGALSTNASNTVGWLSPFIKLVPKRFVQREQGGFRGCVVGNLRRTDKSCNRGHCHLCEHVNSISITKSTKVNKLTM